MVTASSVGYPYRATMKPSEPDWPSLLSLVHACGEPDEERRAGHVLVEVGGRPSGLVFLLSGVVEVRTAGGQRLQVWAPSVFGEVSLLGDTPASAEVRAVTPVQVARVPRARFMEWGRTHPDQALRAMGELSRVAIQRLLGQFHGMYTALVAHDGRKGDLIEFARTHRAFFAARPLVTTANTGDRLEAELGLRVARRVASGPLGGDQEIGALATQGLLDAVFFFRDPLAVQPHHMDVHALVRMCELLDIPLASNPSTGHALALWLGSTPRS